MTTRAVWLTMLVALVVGGSYVIDPPQVPDLAAQVVRAHLAGDGVFAWWPGWFGGVSLPSYSPISPVVMSWIGVAMTGAISAVLTTIGGAWLFRNARRPALGLITFALTTFVDLFCGRITFSLGFAAAVLALVMVQRSKWWWASLLAAVTFLASPLAGLFLGLAVLAVLLVDSARRRTAVVVGGVLVVLAGLMTVLFPQPGQMPFPWWHMAVSLLSLGVLAAICPSRFVRAGCATFAGATVLFFIHPGAVGTNIDRIDWLAAAPVAVACADLTRARTIVVTAGLLVWPVTDLGVQLAEASTPAASSTYYQPLVAALKAQQADLGAAGFGERVEVINPASQWSAAYVAPSIALARGWDRQLDRTDNPLFYNGSLTPATYHHWLNELAVGWVALPRTSRLDYASVDEAALVKRGPSYLHLVWQNPSWSLYRVLGARPLLHGAGAAVTQIDPDGLRFQTMGAGTVQLQMRWSPYLRLTSSASGASGCLRKYGVWTSVQVPAAGTYTISAQLVGTTAAESPPCPGGNR